MRGLDALRFWLALTVFLGHFAWSKLDVTGVPTLDFLIRALFGNATPGPVAVIVFFVISGFCIHYPYRREAKELPTLASFFVRRWVRTGLPLLAAYGLAYLVSKRWTLLDSIVWSLICEEIYYLLYPALRAIAVRFGWSRLLAVSFVGALGLILTQPHVGSYPSFGHALNWLLGLPCWILGCILAERSTRLRREMPSSRLSIGQWRLAAWCLAWVASALRFHSPIGYPWTLTLYAVFAFFWLQREMVHYQRATPSPVLEWLGGVSYSLYLVHVPFANWLLSWLPDWPTNIRGPIMILLGVAGCIVFGLLIEKPSHRLARTWGQALARNSRKVEAAPALERVG